MVSIFDEALEFSIDKRNIQWPSNKKRDLCNKINVLGDSGILRDKDKCHSIRGKRNSLAHNPGEFVQWSELDSHLDAIDLELRNLGLVGDRPKYAWFATVTPFTGPSGQRLVTYSYGLKELGGRTVMDVTWTEEDSLPGK